MTNKELVAAVENAKAETKSVSQTVYNTLNHGQRQKTSLGRSRESTVRLLRVGVWE